MDEKNNEAPATPKYGSFEGLRTPGKYRWPYRWQPTVAMTIQAVICVGAGYVALEVFKLGGLISLGIGAAVGLGIGLLYNLIAAYRKWQKIHWLDILLGSDPVIYP